MSSSPLSALTVSAHGACLLPCPCHRGRRATVCWLPSVGVAPRTLYGTGPQCNESTVDELSLDLARCYLKSKPPDPGRDSVSQATRSRHLLCARDGAEAQGHQYERPSLGWRCCGGGARGVCECSVLTECRHGAAARQERHEPSPKSVPSRCLENSRRCCAQEDKGLRGH